MKRLIKRILVILTVVLIIAGVAVWFFQRSGAEAVPYRTVGVTRGDLLVSINATGTVEPEEVVDVGAQVAGQILSFGQDSQGRTIDYGSMVEADMVLARIDDSLYTAEAAQARAQVMSAKASVQRAEADLLQQKAKLFQAERDWQRAKAIGPSEAMSQASYDAYRSAYETAKANVSVGQAAILQAQAAVAQAEAMETRANRNLGYCTIKSPVTGVIIDRRVNIGQTVVSSFNAPSLFLIAKDLKRMQIWVAVNEADIGKLSSGLPVTFTVDAFPGETFQGQVGKIRLNASMTQNVVSYVVEVLTDNSNGRLLPYLTANVKFILNRLNDVLLVPNAALRWTPSPDLVAPEFRQALANADSQKGGRREAPGKAGGKPESDKDKGEGDGAHRGRIWALTGQQVRPISVRIGPTDGTLTEIKAKDLTEGLDIVTGLEIASTAPGSTTNPFTPKFPPRGGRR